MDRLARRGLAARGFTVKLAPMTWLGDWANLLLRWTHFVAGIAWIGSSFYFIWLDRALTPPAPPRPGVEGDLWMVHSGGFYQVEKRRPGPGEIPPVLHWFKYEALFTWITGIALLVLVYYLTGAYLLDPAISDINRGTALTIGIGVLVLGWFLYDLLWSSPLARRGGVAAAISLLGLVGGSYLMCRLLSGRAAFMHVGSLLGTIMVANVWLRILPAQQEKFAASYRKAGGDCQLEIFKDCEHMWVAKPGPQTDRAHEMVRGFVARQLTKLRRAA